MLFRGLRALCLMAFVLVFAPPVEANAPREVLDRLGLLGAHFAADCARPVSPQNPYTFFRPIDGALVQIDLMVGPTQRQYAYVIDRAVLLGRGGLSISMANAQKRLNLAYALDGGRLRTMESALDGVQAAIVSRGVYTATGHPTPWLSRCRGLTGST
jgi:hypothetical protein